MSTTAAVEAIRDYLVRMAEIRGTGGATKETSFYSALENLLNRFGDDLAPKVICNGQLRNEGAGNPDFGLYTRNQIQGGEPRTGQLPERGVIEVKGLADKTWQTAQSKQATKYFDYYRLVLVTNYRDFKLIGDDGTGKSKELERYSLAEDETTFWSMTAKPGPAAFAHAVHFDEFLRRVMMTAAPLRKAEDVAWFLASYAKDALKTIEEKDASILKSLRDALETALGLRFEGADGEHFFKSTLVQTLFYGVFSAWVIHARSATARFDWKSAAYLFTVPMVRVLFEQIATPSKLGALGLMPLLDRTADALNRVDAIAFFKDFDTGQAVQHFYEPFLQAFDPDLRRELGVWYTPPDIVTYMVERVDRVLRSEFGKANGLADKSVYILDPCCGTGTFIVAVLRRIEATLREQGADALLAEDLKDAVRGRVFGFELMPAPFVIAHWQVGTYLDNLGASLDAAIGERASIFLTNALTGWEPPSEPKSELPLFPELAEERDAAEHIKLDVPILVVLGNPPYNAYAGTSPAQEHGLVDVYKDGLASKWGIKKFNLDDLYIRFFRVAERRINQLGRGIICYISNYSYISEPSFVVMRETLLQTFDKFWIENMHGDRNRSEYAPDGRTSETVFAVKGFSPGIRQGIVTTLAVKSGKDQSDQIIRYRDDIDAAKADERRAQLLASLDEENFDQRYEISTPEPFNRYSFRPRAIGDSYRAWPTLEDLAAIPAINGTMEKRGGALIDIDRVPLKQRMKDYCDASISWSAFKLLGNHLSVEAARFDPEKTRKRLQHEGFSETQIVPYFTRPFDQRFAYFSEVRPLWNEPRPQLWKALKIAGNEFLASRPAGVANPEGVPVFQVNVLGDNDAMRGHAYYFPERYIDDNGGFLGQQERANLSSRAREYLRALGFQNIDANKSAFEAIWRHALAVGFASAYLNEHEDGLAVGWPRIPLPQSRLDFDRSVQLGKQIRDLLDLGTPVNGVTVSPTEHQKMFGVISATDLSLSVGWGHRDRLGRVNPGRGRVEERDYTSGERESIKKAADKLGFTEARILEILGPCLDVYLNETTCWRCVPTAVWDYVIGGYQVIKKWLSYREEPILGRPLTKEEAREVTSIVRRLAAILLMTDQLDANYQACRDAAEAWKLIDFHD